MANGIQATHLSKRFAKVQNEGLFKTLLNKGTWYPVLEDLNFSVQEGEFLGVMGRNGAGKSTLLRVLGDVYRPSSGQVQVCGEVASLFEMGSFLNAHQTGREYCQEYLYLMGEMGKDYSDVIEEIQEFAELGDFFDNPIHTYSSGMKAKLLFGVVTAVRCDVLLIDEVLVVGDALFQRKAWQRICGLIEEHTCGVLVTHDWSMLLRLCQKAMIIEDHRIRDFGPAAGVINRYLGTNDDNSKVLNICEKEALQSKEFVATSGEPFDFSFSLFVDEMPKNPCLGVDFYIEHYLPGVGWNRVFNCESQTVLEKTGDLQVQVHIPKLPLCVGEYQMSIEVFVPLKPGETHFSTVYTKMNWLNGQSMPLRVQAAKENPRHAMIDRRMQWTVCEVSEPKI